MQRRSFGVFGFAIVSGLLAVAGCGGDGEAAGGDETNSAFQLAISPADDVFAYRGLEVLLKVGLTRSAGFADDVSVAMHPAMGDTALAGVDFSKILLLTGSTTAGSLSDVVSLDAPLGGPVPMVVIAAGSSRRATRTFDLTIGPPLKIVDVQ